jgi:sugar phosphate isomerase/epimerase
MLKTRTGGFGVGFRRGWSDWQRDLDGLVTWAKNQNFAVLDLGSDGDEHAGAVVAAGLSVGSADLKNWGALISTDAAKRADAVAMNAEYVGKCAAHGVKNFFLVFLPEDPSKPRAENYAGVVSGMSELAPHLEKHGARVVIEGYPGAGALCCTPEGYRAILRDVPGPAIGINYDPSHLVRMGVDPIRFVEEFAASVYHVHGKDTEIIPEAVYEFGTEQPPTFAKNHGFGGTFWRYTIPGHGCVRWVRAFEILQAAGYQGAVSIELEDENFNGSEAGEKHALVVGGAYLASC